MYKIIPKSFLLGGSICSHKVNNSIVAHNKYWKKDLDTFSWIGLDSLKINIDWSELFPDGKKINKQKEKYYLNYLKYLKKLKIKVILTLSDHDLPEWAIKKYNGFNSQEVIDSFLIYAKYVIKKFSAYYDYLIVFNNPMYYVTNCDFNYHLHSLSKQSFKKYLMTACNIGYLNTQVIQFFKKNYKNKKIGNSFNFYPAISQTKSDKQTSHLYDLIYNLGLADLMICGKINSHLLKIIKQNQLLPQINNSNWLLVKNTKLDFVGINYYHPSRIKSISKKNQLNILSFDWYKGNNSIINTHTSTEIYPNGLKIIAKWIKKYWKNIPWLITENGLGIKNEKIFKCQQGIIQDSYRISYLKEHLNVLIDLIKNKSKCFGYLYSPVLDSCEHLTGFKITYGFIEIKKDHMRNIKKSGYYWKKILTKERKIKYPFKKTNELINFN